MTWEIREGDVMDRLGEMPDESVQCVVTSPPYWGLRDYDTAGQMGREKSPEEYIEKMTAVFEEVRRVLRKGGTLWLNMGDCYANDGKWGGETGGKQAYLPDSDRRRCGREKRKTGLKPKNLVGMPWRLALALQAAGWWLRRDVVWNKPNPMPESATDRPTTAHEYVFLLTKSARYFYDAEAVKTPANQSAKVPVPSGWDTGPGAHGNIHRDGRNKPDKQREHVRRHAGFNDRWDKMTHEEQTSMGANLRSVWTIPTFAFPEAHFSTFPPKLPEICIKAGTSEKGACSRCGAPWARVVEKKSYGNWHPDSGARAGPIANSQANGLQGSNFDKNYEAPKFVGWEPGCDCAADPEPCLVLDPFSGAGTTGLIARRMGRSFIGIELNPEYAAMSRRRIEEDAPLFNSIDKDGK